MKKKALFSLFIAMAFALLLVACGGSSTKPPFSEVALNCSEQEVISAYGECENLTVNEDGGNVYQYSCVYQEKEGNISINFASDGKVKNISWMYNPQSEDEYNALVNTITEDYTKAYGKPSLTNLAGSTWNLKNANVELFTIAIRNVYKVQIVFNSSDNTNGGNDSVGIGTEGTEAPSATTIYHKGEIAQGDGFTLSVSSVDATPEFMNYFDADEGYEYFFVSFELENTSSEPLATGSFLTIYADGSKCNNISFYDPYDGVDWLDIYTDLDAGRKVKSYISAVVPEDWNEIELVCADGSAFSFAHTDLGTISAAENSGEDTSYHVGETLTRNGMQITLTSALQTDYVHDFSTYYYEPDAGNHFLILMFDIANGSSVPQRFNAFNAFDVYVDDYSSQFTGFLGTDIEGKQDVDDQDHIDILSGKSISGYKVLEVPDGWQKVELTSRQGTFEISPDAVTIQ